MTAHRVSDGAVFPILLDNALEHDDTCIVGCHNESRCELVSAMNAKRDRCRTSVSVKPIVCLCYREYDFLHLQQCWSDFTAIGGVPCHQVVNPDLSNAHSSQ